MFSLQMLLVMIQKVLKYLVDETDNILYADSAYRSEDIETFLESKNCRSQNT